jgi:hypothetical protein
LDKTLLLFLCGFGVGIFVGNLELPSDLAPLDTHEKIIVASTEIWLIIHYVVALTTLPVLAITYLKKRIEPPLRGLPFAFNAGLLCSFILMGLIQVITQIVTT